ncbi:MULTISPECIES: glutamate--cysteine ligase [Xenorhabdus]|uniref:Glutamate--cysteine ligase n=1 Tax=Xenorhabdus ehlersii TaxID=290111 RepID=A0A2D0IXQ6_9GAMM|nr:MULTISPECIES: glutamate--cysteine ligase [Xenorhabdus]MBC8947647.1 bifunctional glutamate--cysteine ligase/glutathione synthetase [Xenorhabdus sp. TS4]MBC8947774.1 bifunctional glutamate--cysteine ligase/glutathione synthetase [Xenorhabdus sp. TS4]MBC8947960.1 bifunctional glutamate--cysteine ligase/glutathione synthetase [Xenorhabdus sp. TS4]PHM26730.1 bifunctional glutamate--cysteine ligase/glutathione synthetase [Xenorhabdus ehlersii]RKE93256.1 glutamate-cysteine ligase [Xenorhabdus ehle
MIPDVSKALSWLEANPTVLNGICRGIERETLRVTPDGHLAKTEHPKSLGASLTHKWITTDFAESLLEFITPVDSNIDRTIAFLKDLHIYTARNLDNEKMWPLSMPCFIDEEENITLAQYGTSNLGRFKTLYREGLKSRYGALMQTISGVHYNFSLPMSFWQAWLGIKDAETGKEQISDGYLRLIRNYYRFGWVIPYLFGASPAICSSFLRGRNTALSFEETERGTCYLPYATSLRMSDLGYTNKSQSDLNITFNHLHTYVEGLKKAIHKPSEEFAAIGIKKGNKYLQLNTNVLQIENELYAPIRPKRVTKEGESPSDALLRGGIEYIEVRSLDINPFSSIGVDETQIRFLDLFLIWCALADAPEMGNEELACCRGNWNKVILEGRKPELSIDLGYGVEQQPLKIVGQELFRDLERVAEILDACSGTQYQSVCKELVNMFEDPSLTFSARVLDKMKSQGIVGFGLELAGQYHNELIEEHYSILNDENFSVEREASVSRQHDLEQQDNMSFEEYLKLHAGR